MKIFIDRNVSKVCDRHKGEHTLWLRNRNDAVRVRHDGHLDTGWVRKYFEPYYELREQSAGKSVWRIELLAGGSAYSELNDLIARGFGKKGISKNGDLTVYYQERECILASQGISEDSKDLRVFLYVDFDSNRIVLAPQTPCREADYALARVARTAMNLSSLLRGDLHLHASGVSVGGSAFIFLGDKHQGKTTSMLNACLLGRADYISNDHIVVKDEETVSVSGVPTSVGVRWETLRYHNPFSSYLNKDKRPEYIFQNQQPGDKKIYYLVSELVRELGVRVRAVCPLRAIILPVHDKDAEYVGVEPINDLTEIFGINELIIDDPCEQVPFWRELNSRKLEKNKRNNFVKLELLFNDHPVYRVRYNENLFEDFAVELNRLAGSVNQSYLYRKACRFAQAHYEGIPRKDGKPMLTHINSVVEILKNNNYNDDYILTIAVLHDILEENQEINESTILYNFGESILTEVNSLTIFKRENESFEREMKRLGDKLKKASCEALLVKAADRLHNLRDIQKNPHCFKSGKVARYKQATAKMLDEIIEPRLQPNRIIKLIRQNLV